MAKRVVLAEIDILPRYRKGVKLITLGNNDEVVWANMCTQPMELIIKTDETIVKPTNKIAIEPRVSKGKSVVKPKGTYEVYINNKE